MNDIPLYEIARMNRHKEVEYISSNHDIEMHYYIILNLILKLGVRQSCRVTRYHESVRKFLVPLFLPC